MATPTPLPADFNPGQILTAGAMDGLRGAFRILQVVFATTTAQTSSVSTTYVNTGASCSITPQSATSKIFAMVNGLGFVTGSGTELGIRLVRDLSGITVLETNALAVFTTNGGNSSGNYGFNFLDSPATTSPITYRTQLARSGGAGTCFDEVNGSSTTITLFEVSA
jgi:hypothetical protein